MSKGVFRAILNGVGSRGEGGVLYIHGDECAYCFPDEFSNNEFRYGLQATLSASSAKKFFYVVHRDDSAMHVLAYPREAVFRGVASEATSDGTAASSTEQETCDPSVAATVDSSPSTSETTSNHHPETERSDQT